MRHLLLFILVYSALYAHKRWSTRELSPPQNSAGGIMAPIGLDRIRHRLAEEKEQPGPLTEAFRALSEPKPKIESKPEPFDFLITAGDSSDRFLQKLSDYAMSSDASNPYIQEDILRYALSRSERDQHSLIRIALHIFEESASADLSRGDRQALVLRELASQLLYQQISDPFELERVRLELEAIHSSPSIQFKE
jgi:hypothetical protein